MVPYDIIENKIIIDNDVFGYLQDTFLYFDIGVGYKKYLLWDWFSIKNKEGELINSKIYW
jgi:hypothetical protein